MSSNFGTSEAKNWIPQEILEGTIWYFAGKIQNLDKKRRTKCSWIFKEITKDDYVIYIKDSFKKSAQECLKV